MSRRVSILLRVGNQNILKKLKTRAWEQKKPDPKLLRQVAEEMKKEFDLLTVDDLEVLLAKLSKKIDEKGFNDRHERINSSPSCYNIRRFQKCLDDGSG